MKTVARPFMWAAGGAAFGAAVVFVSMRARNLSEPKSVREDVIVAPTRGATKATDLVCTRVAREDKPEVCLADTVRALACEGRLNACETADSAARHSWPLDAPEVERPEAWAQAVEDAMADCAIPGEIEVVECREYPCVAALRPTAQGAPRELAESIGSALDRCTALRSAFHVGDDQLEALDVVPVRVPCADGDEYAHVVVAMDTRGEAWQAWDQRGQDDNLVEVLRWMFRRGDDVAAVWPCGDNAQ